MIYVYGPECRENLHPLGNPRAYPDDGDSNDPRGNFRECGKIPFGILNFKDNAIKANYLVVTLAVAIVIYIIIFF